MLKYIAAIGLVMLPVAASAQTCQRIGNFTFCDNGQSVQSNGQFDQYSNGGSGQRLGNQYIYTPPVQVQPQQPQPMYPQPYQVQPWRPGR